MSVHRGASALGRLAARALLPVPTAILVGCAADLARPPAPPPARPAPGYERRTDDLAAVDASALSGRRVALDPGHGGHFRGAIGLRGTTEAEVNLGVALHLRGLLEARGAVVFLTRSDDRDFLTPADSSLRADLERRTRAANAFAPDLFVSIHHNADAGGSRDVNEIQTYYKLGDDGPSLDAAHSIHRYLVRNLSIDRHRVVPGNYFVLRNSDAPAVLTEASYLSHPDVEARLALAAKQRLEAEALLLGIAHYFARARPAVLAFTATDPALPAADTLVTAAAGPVLRGRIDGPFDHVELSLDGMPLPVTRRGGFVEWRPDRPLPQGRHRAALRARYAGGGAARERALVFAIDRPAAAIRSRPWPPEPPADGGIVALRVEVVDAFGLPVLDSVRVAIRPACRCDTALTETVVVRRGAAWGYVQIAPRAARPPAAPGVEIALAAPDEPGRAAPAATVVSIASPNRPSEWRSGFLELAPGGGPLAGAPRSAEAFAGSWVNPDGFAVLAPAGGMPAAAPPLPGYRPWPGDSAAAGVPLRWAALAGGALHGRRIAIDAEGGGGESGGTGPSGTRAASLNLEVAGALAGFLSAAGAEVRMIRAGDFALSEVERVQASEAFRAERYVRIGHRAEPPRVGHYYASAAGRRWAEATARELARLGLPAARPAEDALYPLQQTSCPAVFVTPARVDDTASEERLLAPGTLRAEAYAIFLGLARDLAGDADWPVDSVEVRDADGVPVPGAAVTLGGSLILETDARGRARFARTEPGPMEIEVVHPRVGRRTVLLDSRQGTVVAGSRNP